MRNLKKILALVLALVMSLSLMATAGASSFSDVSADNPYADAIDVLDQLKVFQGFEDGTFKPTDTLNRAQAAVLVYRIATGDVEGKYVDNYTYMAQSKFVDLDGYNWAKGYINYCQNAEIVVGTDATHFAPGAKVTGYQLLVMLLRTLKYGKAGEFSDPKGWELQTAAIAEREGILKNITSGDLGAAAPRQMVAEILFRGLLTPTVEYTALNGYTKGETLGKKNLGLEEIEGIVVANEHASLTGNKTLAAGKTALKTADKTYTLNIGSTLDDIGEYRCTYVIPAASRTSDLVCTGLFGDEANNTWETTDAEKVSDSNIPTEAATEKFINFGEGNTYTASDWRIRIVAEYKKDFTEAPKDGGDYTYTLDLGNTYIVKYDSVIKPKAGITDTQMKEMRDIFQNADTERGYETSKKYVKGEVYVGTQSYKDVSDELSWDEFEEKYLVTKENGVSVTANNKGNWLKVIDNDGDGYADYVFKVVYTMALVTKDKDGAATALDVTKKVFADEGTDWERIGDSDVPLNYVSGDETIVCADELVKGDVVYYAVIDGKVQAYKAEVVPGVKIDKVDSSKLIAYTTDGADYTQSEVHSHIQDTENFKEGVRRMVGKVAYDLYLDRGGYLAAYIKSEIGGNMVLLTDGWFMAQRGGDEYAAKVYNRETGDQDDTTITSGGSKFIYNAKDNTVNNAWDQLRAFNGLNNDGLEVRTIVAVLNEDGTLLPVDSDAVYTRSTKRMIDVSLNDKGEHVVPGSSYAKGVAHKTVGSVAYDSLLNNGSQIEIRALSDTVYYFVYPDNGGYIVKEHVGYSNLPVYEASEIEDVYAVGTLSNRYSGYHNDGADDESIPGNNGTTYYTADVIVVEFNAEYASAAKQVFIYDLPVVTSDITYYDVKAIDEDGADTTFTVKINSGEAGLDKYRLDGPGLYYLYETAEEGIYRPQRMSRVDIRDSKFVVGQVATSYSTGDKDYVEAAPWNYDEARTPAAQPTMARPEYEVTDTICYNLDYTKTTDKRDHYGVVSTGSWDVVLDETVTEYDGDGVAKTLNNNILLLTKNGKAVYAVSFTHLDDAESSGADYAYTVWENILPATPDKAKAVEVTFYGATDTGAAGKDQTAAGDKNITVDYADATATGLVVENAYDYIVTPNVPETPSTTTQTYILKTKATKDSDWETWTLKINGANSDKTLHWKGDGVAAAKDYGTPTTTELTIIYEGASQNLQTIENEFVAKATNARSLTWVWYDNGTEMKNTNTSLAPGYTAKVTVEAEDGSTAVYTILFNGAQAVADYLTEVCKTPFVLYYNNAQTPTNSNMIVFESEADALNNAPSGTNRVWASDVSGADNFLIGLTEMINDELANMGYKVITTSYSQQVSTVITDGTSWTAHARIYTDAGVDTGVEANIAWKQILCNTWKQYNAIKAAIDDPTTGVNATTFNYMYSSDAASSLKYSAAELKAQIKAAAEKALTAKKAALEAAGLVFADIKVEAVMLYDGTDLTTDNLTSLKSGAVNAKVSTTGANYGAEIRISGINAGNKSTTYPGIDIAPDVHISMTKLDTVINVETAAKNAVDALTTRAAGVEAAKTAIENAIKTTVAAGYCTDVVVTIDTKDSYAAGTIWTVTWSAKFPGSETGTIGGTIEWVVPSI